MRHALNEELLGLAVSMNARCVQRRQTCAVADEQDDVTRQRGLRICDVGSWSLCLHRDSGEEHTEREE
jgi:hypothetical protein